MGTDPGEAVESFFWWFRRGNIGWFMLVPFLVKKDVGFPEGIEDICISCHGIYKGFTERMRSLLSLPGNRPTKT